MLHSFENNAPVPEVFAILSFFILFCKFLWATLYGFVLARAVGVPVGRCSGGQLAMTLVVTIIVIIFFVCFSFTS